MGRWPWILSFREKQNSTRVKDVEVLSILAEAKNAKRGIFFTLTALMGNK
jgi:hypothetical protein